MKARYILTENLTNIISNIREKKLGYTHENFAEIMDIQPSTSYYLCKRTRVSYITPDKLLSVFAVSYNCDLFIRRYKKMEVILEQAIKDGVIKKNTTLKKIFGTKPTITENYNSTSTKPPIEIYTEQNCKVPREFFMTNKYNANIFDDSLFKDNLHYIKIPNEYKMPIVDVQNGSINHWEKEDYDNWNNDLESLEKYISKTTENLIRQCPAYAIKTEYWLFATYLLYKEVDIDAPLWEYIKKCYFIKEDTQYSWLSIFSELGKNKFLKQINYYEDTDNVYFRDKKESAIDKNNLPVFYYRYKSSSSDENKKDYYETERENAVRGKIKLIDIFMMIFQYLLSIGKNENEAFKETCIKLHLNGIYLPFNNLNLFNLPERKTDMDLTSQAFEFYIYMKKYFDEKTIDKNEKELLKFKNNCLELGSRLFNVIAVDFDFIKNISPNYDDELRMALQQATDKFKSDNLL